MRPFERGKDDREAWMCLTEAFRDHRGHIDLDYEEWAKLFFEHPNWSAELSPVIYADDQMIAAAMVFDYPNGGWVRTLGVLRSARKKGLGLAMLSQIFQWCYARGIKKVGLGVDAESLTGATRLYERAGMRIKTHFVRFEKKVD
jgi:GNAT superfamily N-acetyltransferase